MVLRRHALAMGPVRTRRGTTLAEVLVALAGATIVVTVAVGSWTSTHSVAASIADDVDGTQRRRLAVSLLRHDLESAAPAPHEGRDVGIVVVRGAHARFGDELDVVGTEDGTTSRRLFHAGRDGGGRPNLYARTPGSVRQPWVMGVERLEVTRTWTRRDGWVDDPSRLALAPSSAVDVEAVEVELTWLEGWTDRFVVSTVRSGGVEVRLGTP